MDLNLRDHVAVVTGGASGIGRAVARQFAAEGARVAVWDIAANVADAAGEIGREFDVPVTGIRVDVSDFGAVSAAVSQTETALGPIEHGAHCAAIGSGKYGFPFTNLEPGDWPRVLEVNIMGMVHVAHALAAVMTPRQRGTLIFVASVAGQIGSPTDPPYSASKAANINFAQCLAKDLAAHRIRVNTVCPGMVETPLNRAVWKAWYDRQGPENRLSYADWAGEKIRQVVPLGHWQRPEDVADMIVFLSSDRAAQVTGQTINVDGGYVMHW